jgi:undecaprenyl-diphosphatase
MPYITDPKNWFIPVSFIVFLLFLIKFLKTVLGNHSTSEGLKELRIFGEKMILLVILVLIVVGIGDYTNHKILKPFFGRTRPCSILSDVNLLLSCSSSFSFPSSHSVNIFSIATVVSWQFRISAAFMFFIAMMVCYSRVYVGVHYPFDVTAGALYGIICGGVVILLKEKYIKVKKYRDGKNNDSKKK